MLRLLYVMRTFYKAIMWGFIATIISLLFSGEVGSALFGVFSFLWQQRFQDRQKQVMRINSALAAFENTRISLLIFKAQQIVPASKEWEIFFKCNNINQSRNQYDLSIEQINKFKGLKYPFELLEEQTFYSASFSESLAFIAEQGPENLIVIHKAYETLRQLNQIIFKKNGALSDYKTQSLSPAGVGEYQVRHLIDIHNSALDGLKIIVDNALASNQMSAEKLVIYAKKNYRVKDKKIFQKKVSLLPEVEDLMPPTDHLKEFEKALFYMDKKEQTC